MEWIVGCRRALVARPGGPRPGAACTLYTVVDACVRQVCGAYLEPPLRDCGLGRVCSSFDTTEYQIIFYIYGFMTAQSPDSHTTNSVLYYLCTFCYRPEHTNIVHSSPAPYASA